MKDFIIIIDYRINSAIKGNRWLLETLMLS